MSLRHDGDRWQVICDRPGCARSVDSTLRHVDPRLEQRSAVIAADALGWDLARFADILLDFCPAHGDVARRQP